MSAEGEYIPFQDVVSVPEPDQRRRFSLPIHRTTETGVSSGAIYRRNIRFSSPPLPPRPRRLAQGRKPLIRKRNLFFVILLMFIGNVIFMSIILGLLTKGATDIREGIRKEINETESRLDEKLQQHFKDLNGRMNFPGAIFPQSCSDFLIGSGVAESGVYTIYPYRNSTHREVYCDLVTDGGGWMVFQRRIDGSENFYRNFDDYVKGFGRLNAEFWIGLNFIHELTKDGEYEMRVDMEDFDNQTRYALYNDFVVGEGTNYTLIFGGYSGNAGQALGSARFSTKDRDQDTSPNSCSNRFKGGWWYTACHAANPNGLYLRGPHKSFADGIEWGPWHGYYYSLKRIDMKLKKK